MPFKHNAARRHRIAKARYRVRSWPAYEAGLRRRGDLTLWLDEAAIAGRQAPRRTAPGGQARCSDAAIEPAPMLRPVFHPALRQAEGFARSVLRPLRRELRVPDHTTPSRRSRGFAACRPKIVPRGPLRLVTDSTGLKLSGQGEWDEKKQGRRRRSWRKLRLAVDAGAGGVVASVLTDRAAHDAGRMPALLEATEGEIASATADGAYDGGPVYRAITSRQPDPVPGVVIPPRASAVPGTEGADGQSRRDRHIRLVAGRGRMVWREATGHGRRSLAETAVGPHKALIGPKLRARGLPAQQGEAALAAEALNRTIRTAKPISVRVA